MPRESMHVSNHPCLAHKGQVIMDVARWQRGRFVETSKTLQFGADKFLVWQLEGECGVIHHHREKGSSAFMSFQVVQGDARSVAKKIRADYRNNLSGLEVNYA